MNYCYWRKVLIDTVKKKWLIYAIYFNLIFAFMHYIAWGKISSPNRELAMIPFFFLLGLLWSLVYRKTKTIKFGIIGHMFANLFGFAALFMR